MKITFDSLNKLAPVTVVPVFKGEAPSHLKGLIGESGLNALKVAKVDGIAGRNAHVPAGDGVVFAMGAGEAKKFNAESFAAKAVKALRKSGQTEIAIYFEGVKGDADDFAKAGVGARLAAYGFDIYKTKLKAHQKVSLKTVRILCDDAKDAAKAYDSHYGPIAEGVVLARDLVNEPPNVIYPEAYANRIKGLESGLEVEVLSEAQMEKLGMWALLGVGKGSVRDSQLVIMRWNGGKDGDAPAMLVGKGVTFDTGGISLKPGSGMWDMKGDMGGSAAVVGTMHALAKRKAKANVIGIVGLVENMPDGMAQLPGDIVTSMSGQTIEVQNTDAEGRLVLADALFYGIDRFKPDAVVDLATLTGAIIISLGHEYAGLFTPSDDLSDELLSASKDSGEKLWRLPLDAAYDKQLDTDDADMKNIGGREAGSITAAQFLKRFVGETKWAHLDIAGTGMKNKRSDPRETTFGTGYGVRLLNQWIADEYED